MANLTNFVSVPANATVGGAPIDAFQGAAFRQNDTVFNAALSLLAQSPLLRNDALSGNNINLTTANAANIIVTDNCTIGSQVNATRGVPIIVLATQSITINALINASGLALPTGSTVTEGHVGGSGGGGTASAGGDIVVPFSKGQIHAGGTSPSGVGTNGVPSTLLRFLNMLPMMIGGAKGGGAAGGMGGGIVVLAAPTITLSGALTTGIDVSGQGATAGASGGGGGGGILIMATTINGFNNTTDFTGAVTGNDKFKVSGGAGNGGGNGGNGIRVFYNMP